MSGQKQVVIVHGAYGYPGENWFPWLQGQLEAKGYSVTVPTFPTPEGQTLQNWMQVLDHAVPSIGPDTIMVGHSTGPLLILKKLEQLKAPITATYLVSPFVHELGKPEFDSINSGFYQGGFDWPKIVRNAGQSFVYSSDNDPYVPLKYGQEVAERLAARFAVIPGAGHFNAAAGYTRFDRLLTDILALP